MTVFIVIGAAGLLMILLSLFLHHLFEGIFEALDIDAGSGLFSAPVIGAFLTAFGFGGALISAASGAGAVVALLGAAAAGVVIGGVAFWMTRSLMLMPTDEPVRTVDVIGKSATVVTRIPAGGYGEVALSHRGQRMKLNAKSAEPLPVGEAVVVTAVTSSSSVLVEPESTFWGISETGAS